MFYTNHKCWYFYFQVPEFYHNSRKCINKSCFRLLLWMSHAHVLTVRFYEYILLNLEGCKWVCSLFWIIPQPHWTNLMWVHFRTLRGSEPHALTCWFTFIKKLKIQCHLILCFNCNAPLIGCIGKDARPLKCSKMCWVQEFLVAASEVRYLLYTLLYYPSQ
jgi:hypothetical protein